MATHARKQSESHVIGVLRLIRSMLVFVGETVALAAQAIGLVVRGKVSMRATLAQMAAIGADGIPIVLITNMSTGAVFTFYVAPLFVRFGASQFVGGTMVLAFALELAPLLAGIAIAARSGAAIAAEIGSMVVTEQVDALRAMAVSPIRYLVGPRVLACVIMMPIVGMFANAGGIGGSCVTAMLNGVTFHAFLDSARAFATDKDLIKGLIKTAWFGLTIATVACHQGLSTRGGATGVGQATTRSVVLCIVLIFISDVFLAQVLTGASVAVQ